MVRGQERRVGQKGNLRGQGSGHRVDGRDFQRGVGIQARQDGRDALGQHGLARSRGPQQGQVMPARRADLGGTAGQGLAEHLAQVGRHRPVRAGSRTVTVAVTGRAELGGGRVATQARCAAQPIRGRGQAGCGDDAQARYQGGLGSVLLGHHDRAEPAVGRRRGHGGQDTADRPQAPVEAELAEEHHPVRGGLRHRARRGEQPDGDGQIKPATAFGQAGWGKPDRDLALGPLFAAVDDRGVDPVPGLPQRGVRQTDQDHPD